MILIVLTDRNQIQAIKRVLARVGFVLLPVSILFIKYYPDLGRAYAKAWTGTQYFVGVAEDKNMLGMTCMVFGFAAAWRVAHEWRGLRRKKPLLVHGTLLAMTVWLLSLADSMSSLSCLLLATAVMFAQCFWKVARKRAVVHLMVASAIMVSFSALFLNVAGGVLDTMGRDSTLTGRTDIWDAVLNVPINSIVGTGFESFWLGDRVLWLWSLPGIDGINEAHNGYIEVYLNLGWIGVSFLLGLIFAAYGKLMRALERDPEGARLRLGYLMIAVIYNFTEAAVRTGALVWIALLIAIMVPEATPEREPVMATPGAAGELVEAEAM